MWTSQYNDNQHKTCSVILHLTLSIPCMHTFVICGIVFIVWLGRLCGDLCCITHCNIQNPVAVLDQGWGHRPLFLLQALSAQFRGHPWFFAKITQISNLFAFPNFRKMAKFAASIEHPKKPKLLQLQEGFAPIPWPGALPLGPTGRSAPRPPL